MKPLSARALAFVVSAAAVVVAVIAGAPAAFAGSNGQHLYIHDGPATYSVSIAGRNQYGNWTTTFVNTPRPWTRQGWWWKFTIYLNSYTGFNTTGRFLG